MAKKPYLKPEVRTKEINLGVYGEYTSDPVGPVPTPPPPRPLP